MQRETRAKDRGEHKKVNDNFAFLRKAAAGRS